MPSSGIKVEHQVIRILADGPKHTIEMRRELGWSVFGQHQALERILQKMLVAGMVEPAGPKGVWQLVQGLEVCPHCLGKGLVERTGTE